MFFILDSSFKRFENCTVKLSAKETKWTSLLVRTHPTFLETLISKYDFGPVKLPGLSRNGPLGPFLQTPGNLTGPKSNSQIKVSRKVSCVLASNEVHFVSLADNFTVKFSNLLKLSSGMKYKTT